MIQLAKDTDLETVLHITRDTISKIYPKYYAKGVVAFFLQHHKQENVLEDIENERVWLLKDDGYFVGTVTIKENAVNRLFVLPEFQSHGFGSKLMDFAEERIAENYSQIHIDSSLAAKEMYLKRGYKEKRTCKIVADNGDILVYDEMEKTKFFSDGRGGYRYYMFPITIRNETESDFREVEILTRKAFWNVNVPGCDEHYLAHVLRDHEDFIPKLDLVAETEDGKIVGNVMYTKAKLVEESGRELSILTFGPISVHPDYQRRGISRKLLEFSFDRAIALGYKVIVIFGNPDNYVSRGFKSCKKYNICTADGSYPAAMLVKELVPGTLNGTKWVYRESPACEFEKADAEKFDEQFEPMKKDFCPSQEEFYIHSHSIIRD